MEITRLDGAEVELAPVVAGIFPPLKKLGDSPEICFKVICHLWGKSCVTCSLWPHDFSVAFRTCFSGTPRLWLFLAQPHGDNSQGTKKPLSITDQGENSKKSCYPPCCLLSSTSLHGQRLKIREAPWRAAGCCMDLG